MKKRIIMVIFVFIFLQFSGFIQGAIPASERAALIALYNSTNGDNWTNMSGWKTPPLSTDGFAMPGTEGSWYGVTLSGDSVINIDLQGNRLNGIIPRQLGNLSELQYLDLRLNHLIGGIPSQLDELRNLKQFFLEGSRLSDYIPSQSDNPIHLENPDMSDIKIPSELISHTQAGLPDLTPYLPAGWTNKIIISNVSGSQIDDKIYAYQMVDIGYSAKNIGTADILSGFRVKIWVDSVEYFDRYWSSPLLAGYYFKSYDHPFTFTDKGPHSITVKVDSAYNVIESDENNNEYTRYNITVYPVLPRGITTNSPVSSITTNSAVCGGDILLDGCDPITARGVCWNTSPEPTIYNSKTINGTGIGSFTSNITGLTPNTTYYVRAYATNSVGTAYGSNVTFTTLPMAITIPTVSTYSASSVTSNSAVSGGNVTSDGGANVTARGVCWSTAIDPTINNSKTTNGSGMGSFTSYINGLNPGTTYYARAYATNSAGTGYGQNVYFTTPPSNSLPTVTTNPVSSVTANSATCGGNVISDGGLAVSARGVCWSTSPNPTTSNSKTYDGSGIGSFTSNITGLNPGPMYYIRAYATNSLGTSYGSNVNFTTDITIPTVTTYSASSVTSNSAVSGGNVTLDGGSPVTQRGVCWSTSSSPTINNSKTNDGSGTGTFSSNITGLSPNTTYFVRAYATNSIGTAYGSNNNFTTTGGTSNGLIAYYPFNGNSNDESGNGNHATAYGNATLTTDRFGTSDRAYYFDGDHDYLQTGASSTLQVSTNLTFTAWVNLSSKSSNHSISAQGTIVDTTGNWQVYIDTNGRIKIGENNNSYPAGISIGSISWNTWYFIGVTFSSGTYKFYIDGAYDSTSISGLPSFNTTSDGIKIGEREYAPDIDDTKGKLDEVRIYNKTLSASEIESLYLIGGGYPTVTTNAVSAITSTSALCGGNVTSDGGLTVTARGVCWSTAIDPTINNSKTTNGSGMGSFTSSITGLNPGTTYYARAYATNSKGTSYGADERFTTTGSATASLSGRLRIKNSNGEISAIKALSGSNVKINNANKEWAINEDGSFRVDGFSFKIGETYDVTAALKYNDYINVDNGNTPPPSENKEPRISTRIGSIKIQQGPNTLNIDFPPPVFMIHGIISGWKNWNLWAKELLKIGYIVFTPNHNYIKRNPSYTKKDEAFEILNQYTSDIYGLFFEVVLWQQSRADITFICHSEGGVVMRAFVNDFPSIAKKIKKIYTLGTPHSGTDCLGLAAWHYGLGVDQMMGFNEKYPNFKDVPVYAISGHGSEKPSINNCFLNSDGVVYWSTPMLDNVNCSPFKILIQIKSNPIDYFNYITTPGGNFEGFNTVYKDNGHHFGYAHTNLIKDGIRDILINTILRLMEGLEIEKSDSCDADRNTSQDSPASESVDLPIFKDEYYLSSNSSKSAQVNVSSTESATFAAFSERMDIGLSLTDPTGKVITSTNYSSNPSIKYSKTDWGVQYSITNPNVGVWKVRVTAKNTSDYVAVGVYQKSTWGIRGVSNKTEYNPNSQAILNAKIDGSSAGVTITNFQATTYDNNQIEISTINLYDDGKHNDKSAGDGIYGNTYNTPTQAGYYRLKFHADSSSKEQKESSWGYTVAKSISETEISLSRSNLHFGSSGQLSTSAQTVMISNKGGGALNWNASGNVSWLSVSPSSGTGDSALSVSVNPSGLAVGSYTGTITITDPNATNSPQSISVSLTVYHQGTTAAPFGDFATPLEGSATYNSVPVTGWALDDVGVSNVKIYNGDTYIGDAIFVDGARPDVQAAFPTYPNNYKAGWGYMLLTNFLPNGGNGTYIIHAKAIDKEGNEVTLGSKTINCDNAHAVKPFGAIDTPLQGGMASGKNYVNYGWLLTPVPNYIPADGSTISVFVDGVNLGHPTYNIFRADIANLFPGYSNSFGAVGYYYLDTTKLTDGVHTIYWIATDSGGNSDGIGSRYFSVLNASGTQQCKDVALQDTVLNKGPDYHTLLKVNELSPVDDRPIGFRQGNDLNSQLKIVSPGNDGIINIETRELERVEIHLEGEEKTESLSPRHLSGYLIVGDGWRELPVGSALDAGRGIFYWQPGPGFIGEYRLFFVTRETNGDYMKRYITVTITPRFKN
ncbi:MAG: hypothetical protein NT166_08375 [Candidatus Aminicenantes bacterium]|nr:hypothetical protein [Candidatus Aminicenantes bacterium]